MALAFERESTQGVMGTKGRGFELIRGPREALELRRSVGFRCMAWQDWRCR